MGVGADASATGYPIITHADDSGPHTSDVRLVRIPAKEWPAGSMRPLWYWNPGYPRLVNAALSPEYAPVSGQKESTPIGYIPQVPRTFAYWDTDYGVQNEKGLSIGESTCGARTAGWPATPDRPWGYNRAGIEDLSKIALERCETARCAIETMGRIAVEQGFYSADAGLPSAPGYGGASECLQLADATPGDLWVFNVMTGKNNASAIWAAQRIPSNHIHVIANAFTIRKMKLDDSENYLYSPGVTDLAVEEGWWHPSDESAPDTFDFFSAYGYDTPGNGNPSSDRTVSEFYSARRVWRAFNLLSPAEGSKLDPNKGHLPHTRDPYPTSIPAPTGSVTIQMVMDAHRDHYEGTPYDLTKGMAAGPFGTPTRSRWDTAGVSGQFERAISMYRQTWTQICEARPNGMGVTWFGWDAAHGSTFLPFFAGATKGAPKAWRSHDGSQSKFSYNVAWWPFQLINQYSDLNFRLINPEVQARAHEIEREAQNLVKVWQEESSAAGEAGNAKAMEDVTTKANAFAEAKLAAVWDLYYHIIVKYARYAVTTNESEVGGEDFFGQVYPAWWLASPDVGFSSWTPKGPFIGTPEQLSAFAAIASVAPQGPFGGAFAVLPVLVAMLAFSHDVGMRRGRAQTLQAASQDCYFAQA